jgi:hypothetical protein
MHRLSAVRRTSAGGDVDPYDKKAWEDLERKRQRQLSRPTRHVLPAKGRERAAQLGRTAGDRLRGLPGSQQAENLVEEVLLGASDAVSKLAASSIADQRIVRAYQRAGHVSVDEIAAIRDAVDLRSVDKVKPNFDIAYMTAAGISGAATGFAVSGGEILALVGAAGGGAAGAAGGAGVGAAPGAGAGAAPGAGLVVGAIAADTAAILFATARVIFHTAAYYGYNVNRPTERLRALGVMNFATARTQMAKNRAYVDLEKLVGLIVRDATWKQLDQNVVTKIVRRVFELLGMRLTKRKLAAAVPLAGIAIGASLNVRTLSMTADGAELVYRQQFLCDKYGLPIPSAAPPEASASEDPDEEAEIPLVDIVEEEIEAPDDEARSQDA